ncbi:uncharacterized protein LOC130645884 [Hydractinia symbiolongicarpus]|uniref:uncharacterized protein LOC130645884 n=1 Tax=Hydractinia symbiolongicarpus TaxID=13093 RepID=UPI00254EB05A|nr:uncharacterized protein LOC130645884 [Hydractinia symbiolongicarpus]
MMSDSQFDFAGKNDNLYESSHSDDDDDPKKTSNERDKYNYDSEFSDDEPTPRHKDDSNHVSKPNKQNKNKNSKRTSDDKLDHSSSSYNSPSGRSSSRYLNKDSYESSCDEYEDTDDDKDPVPPPPKTNNTSKKNNSNKPVKKTNNLNQIQAQRRTVSQPPRKGQGRGRGNSGRTRSNEDRGVVVNRVLSANRNKSKALHNIIHDLQHQIETLTIENRDLKRAARLQDREIRKLDNAEAELPSLLKKHSSEMFMMQEKFRKQKEVGDKAKQDLKKREDELYKTKEKLRKYEKMAKEKNLAERNTLSKKLEEMETAMEEKNKKIAELTRAVQLHEKVRARELKEKNEKYKKAVDEMKRLEQEQKDLLRRLKDKEKALEITNIYSQRLQRRGSKDSEHTLFGPDDPVPAAIRRHQEEQGSVYAESVKKASTEKRNRGSASPRTKMVSFDAEKDSPVASPRQENSPAASPTQENEVKNAPMPETKAVETLVGELKKKYEEDEIEEMQDEDFFYTNSKRDSEDRRLEEIDQKLAEMKRREESEKAEEERRRQEAERELERRIAKIEEERKRKEREEQAAREEELRLRREEQERKLLDDMRKQNEKEQEHRQKALEERDGQDEDFKRKKQEMLEKRKKKEILLARMQAIDRGENPDNITEENGYSYEEPNEYKKPKKKPIFLESTTQERYKTEGDFLSHEPFDFSGDTKQAPPAVRRKSTDDDIFNTKSNRQNSWEFKRTDQNLHRGLPAHSDENSPVIKRRNTKDSDELTLGSPSGRNRRHARNSVKKVSTNDSIFADDKKTRRRDLYNDEGLNATYSPTGVDSPRLRNHKINNNSPFDLFDDPFKEDSKQNKNHNKNKNNIVFSSDEDENDNVSAYQPTFNRKNSNNRTKHVHQSRRSPLKTPDHFGDDDLEEMILA